MYFHLHSCSCAEANTIETPIKSIDQRIKKLSALHTAFEIDDDLEAFIKFYDENAICMPEYQPTLQGKNKIEAFYKEIFQRQNIQSFEKKPNEILDLGKTVIEVGIFDKVYSEQIPRDTTITLKGKYWNVWEVQSDGDLKLKGESYGFFHPVANPEALMVELKNIKQEDSDIYENQDIPFELKAYNALNEKLVKNRDGASRSEFYTNDAQFMPFQEPTVSGNEIKPYLIEYSSRGNVTIDSIAVYTYHYEYFDDIILEYAKFKVKWSVTNFTGRTEGKGIRIWKRQKDKSLKMYRQIGTHNYIK